MCARQQCTGSYGYCNIFSSLTGMLFCNLPSVPNSVTGDKTLPSTSYALLEVVWVEEEEKKKKIGKVLSKKKVPGVEGGGGLPRGLQFPERESAEWVFLCILQRDDALKTTMKPLYSEPVCVLSIRQQDFLTSWQRNSLQKQQWFFCLIYFYIFKRELGQSAHPKRAYHSGQLFHLLNLIHHLGICQLVSRSYWTYSSVCFGSSQGLLLFALKSCWKRSFSENIPLPWCLAVTDIYHSSQPPVLMFAPLCTSAWRTRESWAMQSHVPAFSCNGDQKRPKLREKPQKQSYTSAHLSISPLKAFLGVRPETPRCSKTLSFPNTFQLPCKLPKIFLFFFSFPSQLRDNFQLPIT